MINSPASPDASVSPSRRELVLTVLLATGLSAIALTDVSAYRHQVSSHVPTPDFPLMRPRGELEIGNSQFLPAQKGTSVRLENISAPDDHWHAPRFGLGPVSTIEIYSSHKHAHITLEYDNFVPDQELTFCCNDTVLEHLVALPLGKSCRTYGFDLNPGCNRFTVAYARFNHGGSDCAPNDPRTIAGGYSVLNLFMD